MPKTDDQKIYGIFKTSSSRTLSKRLRGEGGNVLEFDGYQINPKQFEAREIEILDDFLSFDWLIFSHPSAARIFLEVIKSKDVDLYDLDEIQIAALGEMVSDVLRFEQIHTDLIFRGSDNLNFLLDDFSAHESEKNSKKILIIGGISDLPFEIEEFDQSRFEVSFLEIYRIDGEKSADYARQKALLTGGAVDEFVIASADDLLFLREIFREKKNISDNLDFTLSAADANLARFLKDNDLTAQFLK